MIATGPRDVTLSPPVLLAVQPLPRLEPASVRLRRELLQRRADAARAELIRLHVLWQERTRIVNEMLIAGHRVGRSIVLGRYFAGPVALDQYAARRELKAFDRRHPGLGQRRRDLERTILAAQPVAPRIRTVPRPPRRNPKPVRFSASEPAQPTFSGIIGM